jgi:hypothetical protein
MQKGEEDEWSSFFPPSNQRFWGGTNTPLWKANLDFDDSRFLIEYHSQRGQQEEKNAASKARNNRERQEGPKELEEELELLSSPSFLVVPLMSVLVLPVVEGLVSFRLTLAFTVWPSSHVRS